MQLVLYHRGRSQTKCVLLDDQVLLEKKNPPSLAYRHFKECRYYFFELFLHTWDRWKQREVLTRTSSDAVLGSSVIRKVRSWWHHHVVVVGRVPGRWVLRVLWILRCRVLNGMVWVQEVVRVLDEGCDVISVDGKRLVYIHWISFWIWISPITFQSWNMRERYIIINITLLFRYSCRYSCWIYNL